MEYICHRAFRGMTAAREAMDIQKGERFQTIAGFIATPKAKAICRTTSEIARQHFARNDDGKGMTRGALTNAIAYAPREREHKDGHVFRFSEDEIGMLTQDYPHWLEDTDTIIFNDTFFGADVDELESLAEKLGIKTEKEELENV